MSGLMHLHRNLMLGAFVLPSCLAMLMVVGCKPQATNSSSPNASVASSGTKPPSESHSHAHSHEHGDVGEHGGHLVHLEPSGSHAEWAHDDASGTLTVYLEEIVSGGAKVDRVQVELEVTGQSKKSYDLVGGADDHKIENSVFTIKSPELITALEMPEGVKATLIVVVDGMEQRCTLEHHHDHDHDHDH